MNIVAELQIFTILVIYNPDKNHLLKSLELLFRQTQMVVVCNNSEGDYHIENDNVIVFNFNRNLGIAKAQNIGMKWAFDNGAAYVLQIDQDSLIDDGMVDALVLTFKKLQKKGLNPGLIGPIEHDIDTKAINKNRYSSGKNVQDEKTWEVAETISSGCIISKNAYSEVGGNDERLFIDLVDIEYCWRLRSKGFKVYITSDARLYHKLGNGKRDIIFNYKIDSHLPIRNYYQTRNLLLSLTFPHSPLRWKIYVLPRILKSIFINSLVLGDTVERLRYIFKGIRDAIKSRYGHI